MSNKKIEELIAKIDLLEERILELECTKIYYQECPHCNKKTLVEKTDEPYFWFPGSVPIRKDTRKYSPYIRCLVCGKYAKWKSVSKLESIENPFSFKVNT